LPTIGVLAIQGDVVEHQSALNRLGVDAPEVRLPEQLSGIDGLVIPGGESTTIMQLIDIYGLRQPLTERVRSGMPAWGTCAGLIALADRLTDKRPEPLHLMDIEVTRNAFGRQVDSFEEDLEIDEIEGPPFRGVFIRAPVVNSVGRGLKVLAQLGDGRPVAVRQGRMLATAFHPELTDDPRVHQMFVRMVEDSISG
jgi:5'-phosphate synthase pdxT subunit